jgi:hypothetical protein
MSINVMTSIHVQQPEQSEVDKFSVEFPSGLEDTEELAWDQFNEVLRTSLGNSGFPQPTLFPIQKSDWEITRPELILVAPGIAVQASEYEERFGGIDLEYYREHMSPELFKAFVRHIGSIKGRPDLNISEFVDTPEI